ncbi:unnamed protein product [Schistocephalus solidus]|uniref:Uncharacterized protein n=1 Tax=Schistocephalus solidus TaxID=70667 RepID=A0A183TD45_SCHSO|nr:unnamed protein product [Schistocephalus solidus]
MATSTTPAGSDSLSTKMARLKLSSLNPVPPTQSQLSPNGDAVVVTAAASPGGSSSACSRAQPSAAPLRSGIPRYAIPYRRPDRLPCGPTASGEYSNGHTVATSSTTGPQSEASLTSPPSISPGYGGGGGGGVGRSGGSVGAYDNISDAGSVGGQGPYGLTGLRNGRLLSQRTDLRESTRASSETYRARSVDYFADSAVLKTGRDKLSTPDEIKLGASSTVEPNIHQHLLLSQSLWGLLGVLFLHFTDFLGGGCGSGGGVGDTESEHSSNTYTLPHSSSFFCTLCCFQSLLFCHFFLYLYHSSPFTFAFSSSLRQPSPPFHPIPVCSLSSYLYFVLLLLLLLLFFFS